MEIQSNAKEIQIGKTVVIKNDLVVKASYDLSSNESKLLMYLIATIDSKNIVDFDLRTVKVKDLERVFTKDKKWGSFYKRLDFMCRSIMGKPIGLPKGFSINGDKIKMHEYIHWFKKIKPVMDDDDEISVEFYFHNDVKPFLLSLKERFVQIDVKKEYFSFSGKYTLHLYPAFKAARNEEKSRYPKSKNTILRYGISELKDKLNVSTQYTRFGNFKLRVLDPMVEEINKKSTLLNLNMNLIKGGKGGKVKAVEFIISDVVSIEKLNNLEKNANISIADYIPSLTDLEKLTFAQDKAYEALLEFGIYEGIAYRQILPTIKGADMEGYEDMFVEQAIKIFKKKEKGKKNDKAKSAGAFVNWWTKKKVFDISGDIFFQISDKVHTAKRKLSQERIDNRNFAKDMTKKEFAKWYKKHKKKK